MSWLGLDCGRFRELSIGTALRILAVSIVTLAMLGSCTCGMSFQPGWANGWPGLSQATVFAAFIAGVVFAATICVFASVFVLPCARIQAALKRDYSGWTAFAIAMLLGTVAGIALSCLTFSAVHSEVSRTWSHRVQTD